MERRRLSFAPATPDRWGDLEKLFGKRGACGGCWCMFWRLSNAEFRARVGDKNRRAMQCIVERGAVPGIIAYDSGQPVGWCSVAPRQDFVRLETHRTLKRIDDQPVWSVVCLFVAKPYRKQGMSSELLKAAVAFARKQGGRIVEGYPTEPGQKLADPFLYTGTVVAFRKAGFVEVARPSRTRAIMRTA